jgi:hypothetical protein
MWYGADDGGVSESDSELSNGLCNAYLFLDQTVWLT